MTKVENREDSVACRDEDIIELGIASLETKGTPGLVQEFENRIPVLGLTD